MQYIFTMPFCSTSRKLLRAPLIDSRWLLPMSIWRSTCTHQSSPSSQVVAEPIVEPSRLQDLHLRVPKAQWLYFYAPGEQVIEANAGRDVYPKLALVLKVINDISPDVGFANEKKAIHTLHSFTHGGIE